MRQPRPTPLPLTASRPRQASERGRAAHQPEPSLETPLPEVPARPYAPTILVVDDDESVRTVTSRILRIAGYGTLEALHGEDALRIIEQAPSAVQLVLTDLRMPVMDGHELGARLARKYPHLPVLYMTGYPSEPRGRTPPPQRFLEKPFEPHILLARIRALLEPPLR